MSTKKKYALATLALGSLETNCYIIADAATGDALIIDPGASPEKILGVLNERGWKAVGIVNTHGHYDHIGAIRTLKETLKVPLSVYRSEAEYLTDAGLNGSYYMGEPVAASQADKLLDDGATLAVGRLTFTVIHTPGHTPGGICLRAEDLLFSGDTLFRGTVGRTDLPGGSEEQLMESLKKLRKLPESTIVLPGHGPATTLGEEFRNNPYLR